VAPDGTNAYSGIFQKHILGVVFERKWFRFAGGIVGMSVGATAGLGSVREKGACIGCCQKAGCGGVWCWARCFLGIRYQKPRGPSWANTRGWGGWRASGMSPWSARAVLSRTFWKRLTRGSTGWALVSTRRRAAPPPPENSELGNAGSIRVGGAAGGRCGGDSGRRFSWVRGQSQRMGVGKNTSARRVFWEASGELAEQALATSAAQKLLGAAFQSPVAQTETGGAAGLHGVVLRVGLAYGEGDRQRRKSGVRRAGAGSEGAGAGKCGEGKRVAGAVADAGEWGGSPPKSRDRGICQRVGWHRKRVDGGVGNANEKASRLLLSGAALPIVAAGAAAGTARVLKDAMVFLPSRGAGVLLKQCLLRLILPIGWGADAARAKGAFASARVRFFGAGRAGGGAKTLGAAGVGWARAGCAARLGPNAAQAAGAGGGSGWGRPLRSVLGVITPGGAAAMRVAIKCPALAGLNTTTIRGAFCRKR
jgi:hypothetical protein